MPQRAPGKKVVLASWVIRVRGREREESGFSGYSQDICGGLRRGGDGRLAEGDHGIGRHVSGAITAIVQIHGFAISLASH